MAKKRTKIATVTLPILKYPKCRLYQGIGSWGGYPLWVLRDRTGHITCHLTFEEAVEELDRLIKSQSNVKQGEKSCFV